MDSSSQSTLNLLKYKPAAVYRGNVNLIAAEKCVALYGEGSNYGLKEVGLFFFCLFIVVAVVIVCCCCLSVC